MHINWLTHTILISYLKIVYWFIAKIMCVRACGVFFFFCPLSHHSTLRPRLAIPGIKLWINFWSGYEVLKKSAFLSVAECVFVFICAGALRILCRRLSEDSLTHLCTPTQKHTLIQSYNQSFMTAAAHMWIRMLTLVGCCRALSTDLCNLLWTPDHSLPLGCWFLCMLCPVWPTVVHPASHSSSKAWGQVIFSAVTGSTHAHMSGIKHTSVYLFHSAGLTALLTTCD